MPYPERIKLLSKLGLYNLELDIDKSDRKTIYEAIERAQQTKKLKELDEAILEYEKK